MSFINNVKSMIFPINYNPQRIGYDYLEKVNSYTIHPGVDFNAGERPWDDLGMDVKAIANGKVVYSQYAIGWGHLIVLYHSAYGRWSRYAHLKDRKVSIGMTVEEGQIIGHLGNTGNSSGPHLHCDLPKKEIRWTSYTRFKSMNWVREHYEDPIKWIGDIIKYQKEKDREAEKALEKKKPKEIKVSTWARNAWEKARIKEIIRGDDPQTIVTKEVLITILNRLNLFNQKFITKKPKKWKK